MICIGRVCKNVRRMGDWGDGGGEGGGRQEELPIHSPHPSVIVTNSHRRLFSLS